MRERARVPRGVLRRAEARSGAGERQLPLRRRRARVPARQLRHGRARVPRRVRAHGRRRAGDAARRSPTARAAPGRARRRRASCSTARDYETVLAGAPAELPTAREPSGDDLVFVYTGGTTGSPEGRDVAQRRSLRVAVADGEAGHATARRRNGDARRQARRDVPARVPAHARHRSVHRAVDARRRRDRRAPRHAAPRRRRGVGRGGARARAGVHDRRRRVRARCSPRSTPPPPLGSRRPARDHVVGRHVEPADEARACSRTSRT